MNNDLKALIELHTFNALDKIHMHNKEENPTESNKMGINEEQANLMISALEMKERKVIEIMIPLKNTFMIDFDDTLDKFKINLILDKTYSRIPVYANHNKNDILGLVRIKQLIGVDFNQSKSLRQLGIEVRKPIVISPKMTVIELLREFRKGKSHMAFVTENVEELQNKFGLNRSNSIMVDNLTFKLKKMNSSQITILGIVTLEDVIEKMINLDILDEDDLEKMAKQTNKGSKSKISNNFLIVQINILLWKWWPRV